MSGNEVHLLDRAKSGDMDAFAALFEPLRESLYSVACRLVGPGDAEDVTTEAFLKAWQALPGFGGRSELKTWLYRIAHNCAVDTLRRRDRRREVPLGPSEPHEPALHEVADESPTPDRQMQSRETVGQVRRAMARLSDEHRTSLELRYADGLSYAEIAAATGVSIGTVMSRLFNAKRRLQRVIEEREI